MASQQDLQDLLRLLTTGRNKLPMLAAMAKVKALQAVELRSVSSIATADLAILNTAMGDEKSAKQLQTAAKSNLKEPTKKRSASESLSSETKRKRSQFELADERQSPQAIEAALELPESTEDEDEISKTVLHTNRAPLVLAFAVALLKHTMPEQPPSSRLSLAQAVVSMNSRSKAVSIGIASGSTAEQDGWGHGQPKVKVMGRDVYVLKRSGYEWKDSGNASSDTQQSEVKIEEASTQSTLDFEASDAKPQAIVHESQWAVSKSVSLKKSTFIARSIGISSPTQARSFLNDLMVSNAELRGASHNITAWRVQGDHGIIEECNDDGETGGGRHILGLLQISNLTGILLVVTRWYGGVFLSTDRWRLMSEVARDVLSQRLRIAGTVGQEALWGLDLEAMKSDNAPVIGGSAGGLPIHKPESARAYIMKAFASAVDDASAKKKSAAAREQEKEKNLGLLLAALNLLFRSWVDNISRDDLDRRAWSWYMQVRPEVESGAAGWGGKGDVRLADILALRRKG